MSDSFLEVPLYAGLKESSTDDGPVGGTGSGFATKCMVMNGSPVLNLHETSTVPSSGIESKILGPFQVILRCIGLDPSHSSVRKDGWAQTIIRIVLCALICIAMFLKCLILVMEQTKPMTLEWAVSCVLGFMALHGFNSALCIAWWTRSRFLESLEEHLALVRGQREEGPSAYSSSVITNPRGIYGRIAFGAVILITIWFLTAMKGILYEGVHAGGTTPFAIGYPVNLSAIYGAAPVICLAFGLYSSLALAIHTMVFARVNHEWELFNEDVVNSVGHQQLKIFDILGNLSSRQSELIRLVNFVSQNMMVFVSLSSAFGALTSALGIYWMIGLGDEVSISMKLIGFLWMNTGIALIMITLNQPAQIQSQIRKTAELLLADDFCRISSDNQVWRTIHCMVDRARYSSTKMYFLQAFAIDQHFPHKVLLIAPNIGTLMVLIKKMGLV